MKLSQCTDTVHEFIRQHPDAEYHYYQNVGTANEQHETDRNALVEIEFPYFSLMIILRQSGSAQCLRPGQ